MRLSLRLFIVTLMLAAVFGLAAPSALAQCTNCLVKLNLPPVEVATLDNDSEGIPGTSLLTDYVQGPNGTPIAPGFDLQAQAYNAWCVDLPAAPLFGSFRVTSPISTLDPALAMYSPNWAKVNYVLNHRTGMDYHDVQRVIWILLGQQANIVPGFPEFGNSAALLADANANGAGFVPGPGQIMGVIMPVDGFNGGAQDTMLELRVPQCGTIGDYVWTDSNNNGMQDGGEFGINGVTVQLKNSLGQVIATAITGFTPAGYPSLNPAPGAPGYYQFTGLCAGLYTVQVDSQPALVNYIPAMTLVGGNRAIDSNLHTGSVVELATDHSIDETIDFGYVAPTTPPSATCLSISGLVQGVAMVPTAAMVGSGGIGSNYSFSSADLPAGLVMAANGSISGTPTVSGNITYHVAISDNNGHTGTINCSMTIAPPPVSATCLSISGLVQGVAMVPTAAMVGSGGIGSNYSFSSADLPAGLVMA
ncbi:MAG: SdrD B-like domain-containing protein, partial [Candidatus Solibacter sp.]